MDETVKLKAVIKEQEAALSKLRKENEILQENNRRGNSVARPSLSEERIRSLEIELDITQRERAEAQEHYKKLLAQRKVEAEKAVTRLKTLDDTAQNLATILAEKPKLVEQAEQLQNEVDQLQNEVEQWKNEVDQLKAKSENMVAIYGSLQQVLDEKEDQYNKLSSDLESEKLKLEESELLKKELEKEVTTLREQLEASRRNNGRKSVAEIPPEAKVQPKPVAVDERNGQAEPMIVEVETAAPLAKKPSLPSASSSSSSAALPSKGPKSNRGVVRCVPPDEIATAVYKKHSNSNSAAFAREEAPVVTFTGIRHSDFLEELDNFATQLGCIVLNNESKEVKAEKNEPPADKSLNSMTTHVITYPRQRTPKAVLANLRGIWIVHPRWILDSKEANMLLPLSGYAVRGAGRILAEGKDRPRSTVWPTEAWQESLQKSKPKQWQLFLGFVSESGASLADSADKATIIVQSNQEHKDGAWAKYSDIKEVKTWSEFIESLLAHVPGLGQQEEDNNSIASSKSPQSKKDDATPSAASRSKRKYSEAPEGKAKEEEEQEEALLRAKPQKQDKQREKEENQKNKSKQQEKETPPATGSDTSKKSKRS